MRTFILGLVLMAGCGGGGGSEKSCETSAQCTEAAPYCSAETCSATCAGDTECPGFGQAAGQAFCVGGGCVTCRAGMQEDCSAAMPVCDEGACRQCEQNDECGSGACAADGSCVAEASVVYVSTTGSATSMCTRADPCSLARGVALTPPRQFLVLGDGTHTLAGSLTINGTRSLIGSGAARPRITSSVAGPIIKLTFGADVTFDHLEITNAKAPDPQGIQAPDASITIRVKDVMFSSIPGAGIDGRKVNVEVSRSTFINNGSAISIVDSKANIDRSSFTGNNTALFLDAGLFVVTNNFIVRNQQGIDLFANAGTRIDHNTVVDNMTGLSCQSFDGPLQFQNNLFARNTMNTPNLFDCALTNSITAGTDIGPIKFKSPDVAPFDYHITAGSSAIDLASAGAATVDFDGESRPFGAGSDLGADELH